MALPLQALAVALPAFTPSLEHVAELAAVMKALAVEAVPREAMLVSVVLPPVLVHPGDVHPLAMEVAARAAGFVAELRAGLIERIGIVRLGRGGGGAQECYGGQHEQPSHAGHGLLPRLAPRCW